MRKGGSKNKSIKPKYFQTLLITVTISLDILFGSHPEKRKRAGICFLKRLTQETSIFSHKLHWEIR